MGYDIIEFQDVGKKNTRKVFEYVNKYLESNIVDKVLIASTTGYTARIALEVINKNIPIIVCMQDISEEYSMKKETYEYLSMRCRINDIPRKYLSNKIGLEKVNALRRISQGVKVCIELVEFERENTRITFPEKILVIGGTLKGADTAIIIDSKQKSYCVDTILCWPRNEVNNEKGNSGLDWFKRIWEE